MDQEKRKVVMDLIAQKLGFNADEEELSPDLRDAIGAISNKLEKVKDLANSITLREKHLIFISLWIVILAILNLYTLILSINKSQYSLVFFCCLLLILIFFSLRVYSKENNKQKRERKEKELVEKSISDDVSMVVTRAKEDLRKAYITKIIGPTTKHVFIDFSEILKITKSIGITLQSIECPNCKAPISIPSKGNKALCQYCGKEVYIVDIFKKLQELLGVDM